MDAGYLQFIIFSCRFLLVRNAWTIVFLIVFQLLETGLNLKPVV